MTTIRRAGLHDAAKLSLLGGASFLESFANDHPGQDLVDHVTKDHSIAVYEAWLADVDFALWLVEEAQGAPIGYAVLGPPTLIVATAGDIELKRIYILYRWHRRGLGKALFDMVETEARARRAGRLILAVYEVNHDAQRFYRQMGFSVIGATRFLVGTVAFNDLVMGRAL